MRKIGRRVLAVVALVACLCVSQQALAVSYEDSLDDCSYPPIFDVMILRPLSLVSTVAGAALFFPIALIAFATVPSDMGVVADSLVMAPARFTFKRRLGECASVINAY